MRSPFSDHPRPSIAATPSAPRPRPSPRAGQLRNLGAGLVALLFLVDLAALLVALSWISAVDPLPAESLGPDQSATVFYDATGAEVLRLSDTENRLWVSWDKIPQALKDAFVAIEDERFWTHSGVDWRRVANAAIGLVTGDSRAGGGSTITQQLVKNITGKADHSIKRKVQEQWAALDLERRLSKQRILELYLNIIYLGNGAYGVQAAARGYFGKDVFELNLAEVAFIAGLTKNPGRYGGILPAGLDRQRVVLRQMLKLGKISHADHQAALATPIDFKRSEVQLRVGTYSWFVDAAIEDIIADLVETYGWTEQVAQAKLFNGGLKIHLTQSPVVQKAVDDVFRGKAPDGSLAWFQPAGKGGEAPQGAMVVMDPRTGDILGLAGGSGEKQQSRGLNRATQSLRQPGSVIKPLAVYAPAVEQGLITGATVFDDAPIHLQGADGLSWDPSNFEGKFKGLTTVKEALAESNNIVAIRVLFELGIDAAIESLRKLGITTIEDADRNGTLALGGLSRGVSVRQVAGAYAALAAGGVYRKPRSYTRVEDANGQLILEAQSAPRQALSASSAGIMTDLMSEVFRSGTGKGFGLEDLGIACAGKSGTTNEVRDKWFAGYTPYLLGVVWFGFDQPRSFPELAQPKKIWHAVMEAAHRARKDAPAEFAPSPGLVRADACQDSGLAPGADCGNDPRARDGHGRVAGFLFTQETVPAAVCGAHQPARAVCTLSAGLATPACPPETVAELSHIKKPEPWQPPLPGDPPTLDAVYEWKDLPPCPLHGGAAPAPDGPLPAIADD